MAETASFEMNGSGWLRRHGVDGRATVSLLPNGLRITGEKGGSLTLYATQVERLRSAWGKSRYATFYDTWIWLTGEDKPLKIHTTGGGPAQQYAAVARGFGAQVHKNHPDRLWRGNTHVGALLMPVLMGMVFLIAAAIGLFALRDDEWWQRMVPAAVPALLTAIGIWLAWVQWPRPVRSYEEYSDQVMPDFTRRKLSNIR